MNFKIDLGNWEVIEDLNIEDINQVYVEKGERILEKRKRKERMDKKGYMG